MSKRSVGVAISYRDESYGLGPCFDHARFQFIANAVTAVSHPVDLFPASFYQKLDEGEFEMPVDHPVRMESVHDVVNRGGLLVIPGSSINTQLKRPQVHAMRLEHEQELIRVASRYGMPVLAICGGALTLLKTLGGQVRDVKGHSQRRSMPKFDKVTGELISNPQLHRVAVESHTRLHAAMGYTVSYQENDVSPTPEVNSAHSEAPDEGSMPSHVKVTATAVCDAALLRANRRGAVEPESGTVEAFEVEHGAPVVGVQWHPEAYDHEAIEFEDEEGIPHIQLIQWMVMAGRTYQWRRQVVEDLKNKFASNASVFSLLKGSRVSPSVRIGC